MLIGSPAMKRARLKSPPRRFEPSSEKSRPVPEMGTAAQELPDKKVAWGKIALGVGSGLAALGGALAATPAGTAFIQEHHLAQCLGLDDPIDLVDLTLDTTAPVGFPEADASAQQNSAWWVSLSPEQQAHHLDQHPHLVGNLEGLPASVRDQANRASLADTTESLVNRRTDLEGQNGRLSELRKEAVETQMQDLESVSRILEGEGRYLLAFDAHSGEMPHAVVASGNPDTADHVAVTVPGVNTTVRSLPGMVREGERIATEAQRQLREAGRGEESVSTVAWVGYDTPQFEDSFCQKVDGGLDSASTRLARRGAESLNSFYQGLQAARPAGSEVNLTALGHSYGSLTTSLALQQGGHGVDNLVVYGSPGLDLGQYSDLQIAPGRGFEMTAEGDKVPELVGRIRWYGEPTKDNPDLVHLTTEETVIDGLTYEGVHAHSQYPQNGSNDRLRVSGYNLASVVADLAQNAVQAG